jgi:hypothetical protein
MLYHIYCIEIWSLCIIIYIMGTCFLQSRSCISEGKAVLGGEGCQVTQVSSSCLSMSPAVHHIQGAPVLKVCVSSDTSHHYAWALMIVSLFLKICRENKVSCYNIFSRPSLDVRCVTCMWHLRS